MTDLFYSFFTCCHDLTWLYWKLSCSFQTCNFTVKSKLWIVVYFSLIKLFLQWNSSQNQNAFCSANWRNNSYYRLYIKQHHKVQYITCLSYQWSHIKRQGFPLWGKFSACLAQIIHHRINLHVLVIIIEVYLTIGNTSL